MDENREKIGYACAYTPLPVINAAGFDPYRILPMGDFPDQAGGLLHDNICPHVKLILDRMISEEIPTLKGMVFMNSCDAMRRLYDAWISLRPDQEAVLIDLPTVTDAYALDFFQAEMIRLIQTLEKWSGTSISEESIRSSIGEYNTIAGLFDDLQRLSEEGNTSINSTVLQDATNRAVTSSIAETKSFIASLPKDNSSDSQPGKGIRVFLFGNVLPDPEVFSFIESCGATVVREDLCTGSRQFSHISIEDNEPVIQSLARGILKRKPCARTFDPAEPGQFARDIVEDARKSGAQGVIGHTVKFCDPYLARLPNVRKVLQQENIPFLMLEGDCTLRSMGQQKTRIEAFIEILRT